MTDILYYRKFSQAQLYSRKVYWYTHTDVSRRSLQECNAFGNIFFRNIYASIIPQLSILISAAYVLLYLARRCAPRFFPSLTTIINHWSVISRDLCPGRTNFSQTKHVEKERDPIDTSIPISKPRRIYAGSRKRVLRKDTAGNLCTSSKWMQRYRRGRVTFRNFSPMDVAI